MPLNAPRKKRRIIPKGYCIGNGGCNYVRQEEGSDGSTNKKEVSNIETTCDTITEKRRKWRRRVTNNSYESPSLFLGNDYDDIDEARDCDSNG
jgi:hypothetical protein